MDEVNSWADAFKDVFGAAVGGYTQIEVAKANRDATKAREFDQLTGQYYLPGQRYTTAPGVGVGGMSQGAVLLIGAALVGVLLLVRS